MWKLGYYLLNHDYVHLKNTASDIVRRVRYTPAGKPYAWHFAFHYVWLDDEVAGWTVTPLTFKRIEGGKAVR